MNADTKADHAAALEWATMRVEIPVKWQNDVSNCAAAYLECDRQLKELRELATAHLNAMDVHEGLRTRKALRAALGEE